MKGRYQSNSLIKFIFISQNKKSRLTPISEEIVPAEYNDVILYGSHKDWAAASARIKNGHFYIPAIFCGEYHFILRSRLKFNCIRFVTNKRWGANYKNYNKHFL